MTTSHETVLVLDFGTQYAQLIARRVREHHIFAKIVPYTISLDEIKEISPNAIILSGGPASVYAEGAPRCDKGIFHLGIPVLGICYGMQLMCQEMGGKVCPAEHREFGSAMLNVVSDENLFQDVKPETKVWMSHGDRVEGLEDSFEVLATTKNAPFAAVKHKSESLYGVQFHLEVAHTDEGSQMLKNFLYKIAGLSGDWKMTSFINDACEKVRKQVGDEKVILGLSGGVDSSVVAALLHKAIGEQLECIFVDNGLLRKDEVQAVEKMFGDHFNMNLHVCRSADLFLERLSGVTDPETKRKIIGSTFIDVFKEKSKEIENARFLAQGTLYPDVIESIAAHGGPTAVIKSHHNVGGLPKDLDLELVEPVRELFKDEVREIGLELGLPAAMVWRQPFPGPGLAVRILGDITDARLSTLREADAIVTDEIESAGLTRKIWQSFAVLLPVQSVGVMGDERTYEDCIAIRSVDSSDAMTANWTRLPYDVLDKMSTRIINEVRGVNRVVYDVSSKPPSTIEWE